MLRAAGILQQHVDGDLSIDSLAASLGVSRRTACRDLDVLRSAGVRIEYCRWRRGFRINPLGFALASALTMPEAGALLTLLDSGLAPKPGSQYECLLIAARRKLLAILGVEITASRDVMLGLAEKFRTHESQRPPSLRPLG